MARLFFALTTVLTLGTTVVLAQTATRIRGTVDTLEGTTLRVTPSGGGSAKAITLSPDATVAALVPAKLSDITSGSFIGTAATTQQDGTLVAREVHIFPERMRGAARAIGISTSARGAP